MDHTIHNTILSQIDHMRPAHLEPGKHVGAKVIDGTTIEITVVPTGRVVRVRYDEGWDLYAVTVFKRDDSVTEHERVYCDQLGELVFGADAGEWTMPFGGIQILDADGNVVEEHLF
jgi:hypothetical protein